MQGLPCPRCGGPVNSGHFHDVAVDLCGDCQGLLLQLKNLVPMLRELTADMRKEIDLEMEIEAKADLGDGLPCPLCTSEMANFGYMGTTLVMLDRCSSCMVVWIDGDELGTVAALFARTEARGDARRKWHEEQMDGLARRVSKALVQRAASNAMAGGFHMG